MLDQKSLGAFSHHFYANFIFNIIYLSSQNNGEPCFVVSQQTGHKKQEKESRGHVKIMHERVVRAGKSPGQVNFDVGQVKTSEISLSGPVSLFESFSLVDDINFQTNYFKTEQCQMSDTIS